MGYRDYISKNRDKIFITLVAYVTFAVHGGTSTLIGSSLLDMQIFVRRSFKATSRIVQARSIGAILGCIFAGLLDGRISDLLALSSSAFTGGLLLSLTPWLRQLEWTLVCILFFGLVQGIFDTCCNSIVLRIWDKNVVNWLQILHMMYGVGALAVPVITRPFLLPNRESDSLQGETEKKQNESLKAHLTNGTSFYGPEDVRVQYPFMIMGSILLIVSVFYMICYLRQINSKSGTSKAVDEEAKPETATITTGQKMIAVLMCAALSNLTFGLESAIGNLTTSFAVRSDLHMEKRSAVLLSTVYWTTFSFIRVLFIPLSMFISPSRLFRFHLLIILIGTFIMVLSAGHHQLALWISFTLLGIGNSPCFSISFSSLGDYFPLTTKMTSIIIVNGVLGETVHTTLLSLFLDSFPMIFIYYNGALSLLFLIISVTLPIYLGRISAKLEENSLR